MDRQAQGLGRNPFAAGYLLRRTHTRIVKISVSVKGKMNGFTAALDITAYFRYYAIRVRKPLYASRTHLTFCFLHLFGLYTKFETEPYNYLFSFALDLDL